MTADLLDAPADPAPPPRADETAIDADVLELGRQLAQSGRSLRHLAHDRAMALVARDPQVRAALFRLVDVAPACAGPAELAAHLDAFLSDVDAPTAPVALVGRASRARVARTVTGAVALTAVRQMAGRFIVGENPPPPRSPRCAGSGPREPPRPSTCSERRPSRARRATPTRRAATRRSTSSPRPRRAGRRARCSSATASARSRA